MLRRLALIDGPSRGDWRTKVLHVAQACVGLVAVLACLAFGFRSPLLILAFAATMGLLVVGVVLFAVVALSCQRTRLEERLGAGESSSEQRDDGGRVSVVRRGQSRSC
jgi:hypothetical protein